MINKIKKEASIIFNVEEKDIDVIEKLLGGMSNHTYKIKVLEDYYVFRIIGEGGNLFVDRDEELFNLKQVDSLNLNTETVYFDVVSGLKVSKYVEGTVLTETKIEDHLKELANTLKKLHHSKLKAYDKYNHIKRLNKYQSYVDEVSEDYLNLKSKWVTIFNKYFKNVKMVFCHNDAQRSNIVVAEDKLYLLDWEYAALNDIYYDFAGFGNVSIEDSFLLLESYLDRTPTKLEINKVKFYRMFQALQWYLVALYKDKINLGPALKLDFKYLANNYLKLATTLYNEIKEDFNWLYIKY